jgi:shikimate dehydrogenase
VRLALLGNPVEHSRSPAIFTAAFEALGMEATYEARSVDGEGVRTAFEDLRAGVLNGLNITMPHKALAYTLCDEVDGQAKRAGSVNTVTMVGRRTVGYSTDIDGIRDCWQTLPSDRPILILGAGGAAAAAGVALAGHEPYVATRRWGKGRALSEQIGVDLGEVRWGTPVVGATIVNCTPLGLKGERLPNEVLALAGALFDMSYGDEPTHAVSYMRERGRPVVDGLDLLVSQAGFGFRLMTGADPPLPEMRLAVEKP